LSNCLQPHRNAHFDLLPLESYIFGRAKEKEALADIDRQPLMPWKCPACDTPIRYEEYDRVLRRVPPFRCRVCQRELVIDKTTDELIAGRPKAAGSNKPSPTRR
jgi:hypothetical protein